MYYFFFFFLLIKLSVVALSAWVQFLVENNMYGILEKFCSMWLHLLIEMLFHKKQ